jgi:limonene-1,2-epoxide hydrolase
MPSLILLTCLTLAASPAISDPVTTVQSYLSALRVFDHRGMSQFWAEDAVSETPGGESRTIDREQMRAMRGFERVMRTKWSWAIEEVGASDVTVRLSEANDLYSFLGSGECVQTVVYSVRDGKITRMVTKDIAYSGQPFREAFAAFKAWLLTTTAASDVTIIREGQIQFTPESAHHLLRWLRIWHDRK